MNDENPTPKSTRFGFLRETLLIVVSVILGYAAAQYASHRQERQLAIQALESIRDEVTYNVSVLEPLVPLHQQWVKNLSAPDVAVNVKSGIDILFETRPPLPKGIPSPFPFLRHSAWDAAVSGGALRLLDYELVSSLSDLYFVQGLATENVARLAQGPLAQIDIYEAGKGAPSAKLLWLTIADIESAESLLLKAYKKQLPTLEEAISK